MDHSSDHRGATPAFAARGPGLSVVSSPLRLASAGDPMPQAWSAALADLAAFLGIDTAFVPAPDTAAPIFAPWAGWSAAAFQNGGVAGLPDAQFVASYAIEQAGGGAAPQGAVDIMLISPHPGRCAADALGLPAIGTLRAMIRAARAEGRERIVVIGHARQIAALEAFRLGADLALCPEDGTIDILAIEDALPALIAPGAPWDAIIAMPDLRSIVFTLIAETSGLRGPWPMLWHNQGLRGVTCEVKGDLTSGGQQRLPLDAPALIHGLALALKAAGKTGAALQLHESCAQLRARGVTTPARGSAAPYATEIPDGEFIALLPNENTAAPRAMSPWRALVSQPRIISGSQMPTLRVVSANIAN